MSDFSPTAGGGAWLDTHSSGPPTPNQSPHGSGMRNVSQALNTPFQCGICYEYLSNSVDDLDEHIMKHKRELAERLDNQAQSTGNREAAYINTNHQQSLVYYADESHAGAQAQVYEYPAQSCAVPAQQFDEARQRSADLRSASRYYAHHPALLHHRQAEQASSSGLTALYVSDCVGRSEGNAASCSTQHDDFAESLAKRARYEANAYEREDHHAHHHHHHAARPDLNEENTADADPPNEHMKDSEHGPVTFEGAQQSNSISYHELQPVKSACAPVTRNNHGIESTAGSFDLNQGESLNDHDSSGDAGATPHETSTKSSEISDSKDPERQHFEMELSSSTGSPRKDLADPDNGSSRSDNASAKNPEEEPAKAPDVEPSGKFPRTRRSVRVHTGRR